MYLLFYNLILIIINDNLKKIIQNITERNMFVHKYSPPVEQMEQTNWNRSASSKC